MVPVALSLIGSGLRWETTLFLGWFGPRGLATVLFGLLVLNESHLAAWAEIMQIAMITVLLSIFLHGVTAYPWSKGYADRVEAMQDAPGVQEHAAVTPMPTRLGMIDP